MPSRPADLCSPPLLQRALALFIQRGGLANHLRKSLPRYRERRNVLLSAMSRYFPSDLRWSEPRGGFNVWVMLPPAINRPDLYLAAIEQGVAFAPGERLLLYRATNSARHCASHLALPLPR